ncbi:unnamed protein product [Didymodactylos carnosus]|uniref:Uncharacterized protein n=1 Tax=Didymodactylos carnosus TaxID=1234261 RepID=A0A814K9Y3_9BILA|nr:unnamed protein product [Didymodactylos carnosus]CAF3818628.1 unnamed protein product [Didymodactylos carnosus]
MHRKAPIGLIELVSADTTTHSHNLRSRTQCKLPTLTRGLQVFEKSFIRTTYKLWNEIPLELRTIGRCNQFKVRLLHWKQNKYLPSIYRISHIVDRTNEINFCRMRIGFSQLKLDLFTHTLVSDPSCSCGADETVAHFFLKSSKLCAGKDKDEKENGRINCQQI